MGAEHFCKLEHRRAAVDERRGAACLRGEHLELREWVVGPGEPCQTALSAFAECFVVPREGRLDLVGVEPLLSVDPGEVAHLPAPGRSAAVRGAACRFLLVGWPKRDDGPGTMDERAPSGAASLAVGNSPTLDRPRVYRFAEALVPSAPGWRFFSVDGAYLTVGCSYREAPPPARERPHSHEGEQINVPMEGRFAFTVGDHTETIAPGWAALTPRGVLHTGLHLDFPYFQLIFATPPRGQGYAEFLRSIYRAPEQTPTTSGDA